jgi:zinc transport system substrate-binding protein
MATCSNSPGSALNARGQMPLKSVLFTMLLATGLVACSGCISSLPSDQRMGIAVTIAPQAEFADSIGLDKVTVTVMVPPGADPHTYDPKPSQMVELDKSKLYLKLGSGIEFELVNMAKIVRIAQNTPIIDCSQGITLIKSQDTDEAGTDPHIWLSPSNAVIMVSNICQGLVQVDPANKSFYQKNRDIYLEKLTKLDGDIRSGLSGVKNRTFIIYHPFLGYFAQEYNLTQISIEELGKEPTASHIAELINTAKKDNIKIIFVPVQFNPQSAKIIANGIGGRVIPLDHLSREYIKNMRAISSELIEALK